MKNMEKLYFDPIDLKSIKPAQDLVKSMKIEKRDMKRKCSLMIVKKKKHKI